MFRFLVACCVVLSVAALGAQNKEQSRLENCGVVMEEILGVEENIPQDLLDKAECVIVIPSMMTVALGVGGNFGRGAMVCRSGKLFDGAWGAPAMYTLQGGSIGFQIGAESTDLVLLVMNPRGVNALLGSKVKLGGNASVSAGPKGRVRGSVDRRVDAIRDPQLLQVARPVRRRVAVGRLASPGQRRQSGGLRDQAHGAAHRHGNGPDGTRVGPSLRQRAAEELSTQRVGRPGHAVRGVVTAVARAPRPLSHP